MEPQPVGHGVEWRGVVSHTPTNQVKLHPSFIPHIYPFPMGFRLVSPRLADLLEKMVHCVSPAQVDRRHEFGVWGEYATDPLDLGTLQAIM
jgi:hypothetical protein